MKDTEKRTLTDATSDAAPRKDERTLTDADSKVDRQKDGHLRTDADSVSDPQKTKEPLPEPAPEKQLLKPEPPKEKPVSG